MKAEEAVVSQAELEVRRTGKVVAGAEQAIQEVDNKMSARREGLEGKQGATCWYVLQWFYVVRTPTRMPSLGREKHGRLCSTVGSMYLVCMKQNKYTMVYILRSMFLVPGIIRIYRYYRCT